MTREEFNASMQRVLVFYHKPRSQDQIEDFQAYMAVLYDDLRGIDAPMFEQVTRELVRSLPRGQKPQPPQFWAIYRKLSEARAMGRPDKPPTPEPGETHLWLLEEAQRLGPLGAQFVLTVIDATGRRFPQDVLDILIDKSTQNPRIQETASTSLS